MNEANGNLSIIGNSWSPPYKIQQTHGGIHIITLFHNNGEMRDGLVAVFSDEVQVKNRDTAKQRNCQDFPVG